MSTWTDDFAFYLAPLPDHLAEIILTSEEHSLARVIDVHGKNHWPDLEQVRMVIIGIDDEHTSQTSTIREHLYKLYRHDSRLAVADLGNIRPGATEHDTFTALSKVVGGLALRNTLAVIIGAEQKYTYANYAAYEALESTVNLAVIDSRIDMGNHEAALDNTNYLSKIVVHRPSYLFNMSVLAYQNYFNNPETVALMDKLYFDTVRLGELRNDMRHIEPHLRNADILSFDINAMANSSAPGTGQPNGLSGEEACRIARYAGLSDNCSSFGIYNYNRNGDPLGQTALLIAQMIWHLADGLAARTSEYPLMSKNEFLEYQVQPTGKGEPITFFKSKRTDKWWMNVPYPSGHENQLQKNFLVPCNYVDYEHAASGDIPELWWKTYRKLT